MPGLVGGAERAAPLQFRHQLPGDRLEVVGDGGRAEPEAGQAGLLPVDEQVGQLRGGAGEDRRVALVRAARRARRGAPCARPRRPRVGPRKTTRSPSTRTGSRPAAWRPSDLGHDPAGVVGVARRHEADVGRRGDEPVGHRRVPEGGDDRLPLRRPRGDRRALDAEVVAGEVDVVQLVAVDEPAGGGVADLGVVVPAVPEPPDDLDVVGRLVEQRGRQLPHGRIVAVRQVQLGEVAAAEEGGLLRAGRHPDPDAGPAVAGVVERRDGLGDVERLGVGDDHGRHQPDVPGQRRHPRGDQHRVEAARSPGRCARTGRLKPSSMVTKSSSPRSASATTSVQ